PRVHLVQSTVSGLVVTDGRVAGVATWEGGPRRAAAVALCVCTFLRARLHNGAVVEPHGRHSEIARSQVQTSHRQSRDKHVLRLYTHSEQYRATPIFRSGRACT